MSAFRSSCRCNARYPRRWLALAVAAVAAGVSLDAAGGGAAHQLFPFEARHVAGNVLAKDFTPTDFRPLLAATKAQADRALKSEFETTAEYDARIQRLPIDPRLQLSYSVYCRSAQMPGPCGSIDVSYNADASSLTVRTGTTGWQTRQGRWLWDVDDRDVKESEYDAVNPFGVHVTVTELRGQKVAIELTPQSWFDLKCLNHDSFAPGRGIELVLEIDRSSARRLRDTLGVLLVGRIPRVDVLEEPEDTSSPTFSWPYRTAIKRYALPFEVTDLYLVDSTSRTIVAHKSAQQSEAADAQ